MIRIHRSYLCLLLGGSLLIGSACSGPAPHLARLDCHIAEGCEGVIAAAAKVVSLDQARVAVGYGRGLAFHAEVHACYPDGTYLLVDVIGDPPQASVRAEPRPDPPCRERPTASSSQVTSDAD